MDKEKRVSTAVCHEDACGDHQPFHFINVCLKSAVILCYLSDQDVDGRFVLDWMNGKSTMSYVVKQQDAINKVCFICSCALLRNDSSMSLLFRLCQFTKADPYLVIWMRGVRGAPGLLLHTKSHVQHPRVKLRQTVARV